MKDLKQFLQNILIAVAGGLVFLPIMWSSFAGGEINELTRHILTSGSIVAVMGVLLLGLDKENKKGFWSRISICVPLLILLVLQWV